MRLAVRTFFIFVLFIMLSQLSGCGTVGGAVQGFSNDVIDLMKFSYRVF